MNINKIIGTIFMLLFLSLTPVVYGVVDDAEVYYSYQFGNFTDLSGNGRTGVNTATTNTSGILDSARDFPGGSNNEIQTPFTPGNDFSVSMWVHPDGFASDFALFGTTNSANNQGAVCLQNNAPSGEIVCQSWNSGIFLGGATSNLTITDGVWNHVVMTLNGTSQKIYVNGVLSADATLSSSLSGHNLDLYYGLIHDGVLDYNGQQDESAIYNKELSLADVQTLYNSGAAFNPYAPGPAAIITFDNVSINDVTNFNNTFYNISPVTLEVNLSTSNTNNNTNVTFFMYNSSNVLINTTQFITNSLNGSLSIVFPYEDTFKFFLNATNNETNTLNPGSGNYTITYDITPPSLTVNLPSEYGFYDNFNFSNFINVSDINLASCTVDVSDESSTTCTNTSYSFVFNGNHTINVTATDSAGNVNSNLNNLMLVNPQQCFNFFNQTSIALSNYTFGGTLFSSNPACFDTYNEGLIIGNNTLSFEKVGFQTSSFTFAVTTTSELNLSFNVSSAEIVITIRDRETGSIVSGPLFSLEFISTVGLITNTTTGTKTITNTFFIPEDYQLITSSANYSTEQLFFTFSNQESLPLTVYVTNLNDSSLGVVEINLVDKFGKGVAGGIVQALQWDTNSSSYVKVSEGLTDDSGVSILNIILDSKQYIFQGNFGGLSKNSTPQIIPTVLNGKVIVISLDVGPTEESFFLDNVVRTITETFNSNTSVSNITFSWTNNAGTDITGCVDYSRIFGNGDKVLVSSTCQTSSSAIVTVSRLVNSSFNVIAEVGFLIDGALSVEETFNYPSSISPATILKDLNLHYYIMPLLYLVTVLIGMANIFIGGIMVIIVSGVSHILIPDFITKTIVAFMIAIGLAIMAGGSKK